MTLDPTQSKKGKLALASTALHPKFQELLAEVAELSVEKGYKPLNWIEKDSRVSVMYCLNAAERHAHKVKMGIDRNTEEYRLDGKRCLTTPLHMAQVAYNYLMAAMILLEHPERDDRAFQEGELKKSNAGIERDPRTTTNRDFMTHVKISKDIIGTTKDAPRDHNGVAYTSHINHYNRPSRDTERLLKSQLIEDIIREKKSTSSPSLTRSGQEQHNVDFGIHKKYGNFITGEVFHESGQDEIDLGGS